MTSNENLNSHDPRAQSQHGNPESGVSSGDQPVAQPNATPKRNPALLPESYLRASEPIKQSAQEDESSNGSVNSNQGQGVPAKETRVPTGKRPEELPIDCTIQMRGRTLKNQDQENQVPWEKHAQPAEPEEKILHLPVKPPPSATNNRLAALQLPADSKIIQSQVEQAATGSFDSQSLDAIATSRQAVRYKPGAPGTSPTNRNNTQSGVFHQTEAARQQSQQGQPRQPAQLQNENNQAPTPRKNPQKQFYSDEDIAPPARTRINPNLLKSSGSAERSAYDQQTEEDESFKNSGAMPKLSWSEMSYLLKFYFREVKSLLLNPYSFFLAHTNDTTLGEPIAFMVISGGISAIFMSLAGDLSGGLSTLFGTSAYAIIAAIAVHYAMDFLNTSDAPKGNLVATFKILAYSQAPLLVAWIKLGVVPAGWWIAFVYSIFLCMVGLEQVYGMSRQKSLMIILLVSLVVHGLLHLIGL
jgi:hypothetical protein